MSIAEQSAIGGMFGRPTVAANSRGETPEFLQGRIRKFPNARSALFSILKQARPTRIWIPSYLCEAILEPIHKLGIEYFFYRVNEKLEYANEKSIELEADEACLFINYFGFHFNTRPLNPALAEGGLWLEDSSQALLSRPNFRSSGYRIYSPRKTIGVPEGGVLKALGGVSLPPESEKVRPLNWETVSRAAFEERSRFDRGKSCGDWFSLFKAAETSQPVGDFSIGNTADELMKTAFDYTAISRQRRENFSTLLSRLRNIALFKHLPEGVVPIGFPVVLDARDELRDRLIKNRIFPAVHWGIEGLVPRKFGESHSLSKRILTIPCDQRVEREGLEQIISITSEVAGAV